MNDLHRITQESAAGHSHPRGTADLGPARWKFLRGYVRKEDVLLKGSGRSVVVRFNLTHRDTWHYQGKGVRLGDARTPICWYRPQGATAYRVAYGDVTVRDVARDDLPRPR